MEKKTRLRGRLIFRITMISLASVLFSAITFSLFTFILVDQGAWEINFHEKPVHPVSPLAIFIFVIVICLILSVFVTIYLSIRLLKPVDELKHMTNKVAKGDFTVQLEEIPNSEVGELITNFNLMVKELQKNEMLKSDFISNVSHEFKTPLSIIQGYATLLQDPDLNEDDRVNYTNIIMDSTSKLTTLVNNILKISKLENQKIMIENTSFPLDEQIRESILNLEKEWSNKSIDFDIELSNVIVKFDKNLLLHVWDNLLSNAIKFSKENGKIEVNLKEDEKFITVSIKDYGIGIDSKDLPYIFDKFYQTDKSHLSQGNGLGLPLVKKIVDLLKGKIEVISKLNCGSEFIVYLPKN